MIQIDLIYIDQFFPFSLVAIDNKSCLTEIHLFHAQNESKCTHNKGHILSVFLLKARKNISDVQFTISIKSLINFYLLYLFKKMLQLFLPKAYVEKKMDHYFQRLPAVYRGTSRLPGEGQGEIIFQLSSRFRNRCWWAHVDSHQDSQSTDQT